jgi:hypothetical protein
MSGHRDVHRRRRNRLFVLEQMMLRGGFGFA